MGCRHREDEKLHALQCDAALAEDRRGLQHRDDRPLPGPAGLLQQHHCEPQLVRVALGRAQLVAFETLAIDERHLRLRERDAPEEGPGDSGEKADFHGALKPYHNAAMRFIAHVDMDAFYASVELLRYPELRGKPLVIGGRRRTASEDGSFPTLREYKGRGVITTATYEARAFGVNSGMALMRAAKRAPDALLLPADFDEYRKYSRMFKEAVRTVAPEIEDRGIDEIYVDLSGLASGWPQAKELAASMQRAVREATQLSCSIGVAPNKLLAKMASELDKPGGLTLLDEADIPARVW